MKDINGRTLKVGDYVDVGMGLDTHTMQIAYINNKKHKSDEIRTTAKLKFNNGYTSTFSYESDDIRKLEIEELI